MAKPLLKMHLHSQVPNTAEGEQGTVTETLCGRFCRSTVVASQPWYQSWLAAGYTDAIFCQPCQN